MLQRIANHHTVKIISTCARGGLPEFLGFYYAHGGFYLTQFLLSKSMPMLVYIWLLISVDDEDDNADAMDPDSLAHSKNNRFDSLVYLVHISMSIYK